MSNYTSGIQLQLALAAYFKSEGLPALTFSHTNKAVYLQGPCGQTICKVFYTGTSRLSNADYEIVYDQITLFIKDNKETLLKIFTLKKEIADGQSLKTGTSYTFHNTTKISSISLSSMHPLYSPLLGTIYSNGKFYNNSSCFTSVEDYTVATKNLKTALKKQQALLAQLVDLRAKEDEVNTIISQLSGCSL